MHVPYVRNSNLRPCMSTCGRHDLTTRLEDGKDATTFIHVRGNHAWSFFNDMVLRACMKTG